MWVDVATLQSGVDILMAGIIIYKIVLVGFLCNKMAEDAVGVKPIKTVTFCQYV